MYSAKFLTSFGNENFNGELNKWRPQGTEFLCKVNNSATFFYLKLYTFIRNKTPKKKMYNWQGHTNSNIRVLGKTNSNRIQLIQLTWAQVLSKHLVEHYRNMYLILPYSRQLCFFFVSKFCAEQPRLFLKKYVKHCPYECVSVVLHSQQCGFIIYMLIYTFVPRLCI